ncbi:MAG TPA: hypothetical protein VK694_07645 [Verrucomicrobiae bacterium]|nr:hypothetical protein [Verrucomicrobiae bacterium]
MELAIISVVIIWVSVFAVSYKTGFVYLSMKSYLRDNKPKYEVDKTKVGKFVTSILLSFLINIVGGVAIAGTIREIGAVFIFSLLNMTAITYALVYWVLLKEKKKTTTGKG